MYTCSAVLLTFILFLDHQSSKLSKHCRYHDGHTHTQLQKSWLLKKDVSSHFKFDFDV